MPEVHFNALYIFAHFLHHFYVSTVHSTNSDGTISRNVTVTQSSDPNAETKTADFQVSPKELTAEAPAGTVPFSIVGDAKWTLSSNTSWATPNVLTGEGNATITVSLKDNTSEEAREATITISSSSKTETVTIRQSAATKPVLSGLQVNNNQKTSVDVTFDYTSMFPVTEYGVCYNTTGEPTINDTRKSESGSATQGSPTFSLTDLTVGTTYYVRAYAKSAVGIQYSETVTITTANNWPGGDDNVPPNI